MKKLMSLLLVLVAALVLVGCNKKTPAEKTPAETEKTPVVTEPVTEPEATEPETEKTPVKEQTPPEVVNYYKGVKPGVRVVTYCTWGFATEEEFNLTRRLIAKFNYEHNDVQIQMVEPDPEMDYGEFLNTLASAKKLPDIFMTKNLPSSVINSLAKELTDVVAEDPEWQMVDKALADAGTYNGHVYGIPTGQYYMGFFANYELLDKYTGEEYAEDVFAAGEFTTQQFVNTVKSMRKINVTDGSGIVGVNATGDMINWLPGVLDTTGNIKHFVWNSSTKKFDFKNPAMRAALEIIADLGSRDTQYTFASVPDDKRGDVFGTGSDVEAFKAGKIGFLQGGTWDGYVDARGFDVEFVGYPEGRVISAADYTCISDAVKDRDLELVYEVAKYLTFGLEGAEARFDIIDYERYLDPKTALSVTGLPVVTNKDVTSRWFEYVGLDGVEEVYDKVSSGEMVLVVEGNKTIPGFEEARFHGQTGLAYDGVRGGAPLSIGDYIWDVCSGDIAVSTYMSDISDQLVAKLNATVVKAYEDIAKVTADKD